MAQFVDSMGTALEQESLRQRSGMLGSAMVGTFTHDLAIAAYMASGMMRRIIGIHAADRTQKWRDWQAGKDEIAAIEAEERRLGLRAKVNQAEVMRGIGGGALLLITDQDHATPLDSSTLKKGGLIAVNVVTRWHLGGADWDDEVVSPTYGQPRMFRLSNGKSIHPSRVVAFRGDPIPHGGSVGHDDAYWGDCRLLRVWRAVNRSDDAQGWFAELVRKAKLLRIGIPQLMEVLSQPDGQEKLNKRVAHIAQGESILNATVYNAASGTDAPGEEIDDYQVSWSGIPDFMDALDQRVAAVADIPFTRLMGRSPAGMNATGQHDMDNWREAVSAGQENELRPCLEQIDPLLLRSAGVVDDDVTWRFAPLSTPSEKEEADVFKTFMEAVEKVQQSATVPDRQLNEAVQNALIEREYLPGLDQSLGKLSDDERYGIAPEDDGEGGDQDLGGGEGSTGDALRWIADAAPRSLYVQRKLLNAPDLIAWAKSYGIATTLPASDMHVTILYSRSPVDPMKMGRDWSEDQNGHIIVRPGGPRIIERLGENAVVLRFTSPDLEWRHKSLIEAGGSHDYPEYAPHVTISYGVHDGVDLDALKPFNGELRFGPEIFETLDLDWKSKIKED